jgi:hypothetical protein
VNAGGCTHFARASLLALLAFVAQVSLPHAHRLDEPDCGHRFHVAGDPGDASDHPAGGPESCLQCRSGRERRPLEGPHGTLSVALRAPAGRLAEAPDAFRDSAALRSDASPRAPPVLPSA